MKRKWFLWLFYIIVFLSCGTRDKEEPDGRLGSYSQVLLSVSDIQASLNFYQQLGLQQIDGRTGGPNPWVLLTEGNNSIMLSQNDFPSPALTYYADNMLERVKYFQKNSITFSDLSWKDEKLQNAVLHDPNRFGITLIAFDPSRFPSVQDTTARAGLKLMEISIPTAEMDESVNFWKKLGFSVVAERDAPNRIVQVSDGMQHLAFLQTKSFSEPALTFAAENPDTVVSRLEKKGLLEGEAHYLNNAVVFKDPDGILLRFMKTNELPPEN
ncbi:MAG: VOC family protein [Calditrichia bacterium]